MMTRIVVSEIPKNHIRSCNNCSARNYKSALSYDGNIVDTLYELQISSMCICLCEDCLREVYIKIDGFLSDKKESEDTE